jgi:modification methylase
MTIELFNIDNMVFETDRKANLIYADYIYESLNFEWAAKYWEYLENGGIMIGQTDYHSAAEFKVFMNSLPNANFVNWLCWKNEFGNFRKDRFRQCHDDIIIFSNGKDFCFDPEKVQIPKATANSKGLNPSGRTTKIATSVITDICLTTVSNERIKKEDGHLVRWQKPKALLRRIFSPFVVGGDLIIDPFMGVGTSGEVAYELNCDYYGIENDIVPYQLAKQRLDKYS